VSKRDQILKSLEGKKIIIWGARMTGLGALRKLKEKGLNVHCFIDSDPAFTNKKSYGYDVFNSNKLKEIINTSSDYAILLAVALKEDEIVEQLKKLDIEKNVSVYSFHDEDAPYYTVDILSSCNLKCASCPHSIEDTDVPKGSMTLDKFKEVFDKIIKDSPSVSHLSLYSWGEPLLHPYLDQIIDYVHKKNVAVALSSNLSINFDKRLEKIVRSKPDYLKISLSGFYPIAYNNTHQGGDIRLVKSNLYLLRYLLDKHNVNTLVDINYHLYKDNSGENIKKIEELADELGFIVSKTYALVMPLERVISHQSGKPDFQTQELEKNLLVTIDEGIEVSKKNKLPKNTCPFRENQININADLSVPICCTVWQRDENVVAKNYLESSIKEINLQKKKTEICTKCMELSLPEYNMGFNKAGWQQHAEKKEITDIGEKSNSKIPQLLNEQT